MIFFLAQILYDIIYLCILIEKYGQSKLGQNYKFSTDHLLRNKGSILYTIYVVFCFMYSYLA